MIDDSNGYKNLDEKFRLAAAEIPVQFDPTAWEALSQQLDNINGTSDNRPSNKANSDSNKWLNNINLNSLIGLIIETIAFIILVTVIIPSALSSAHVPELKVPETIIKTVPVQELGIDKDSTIIVPKQIEAIQETRKPKEAIAPVLEIKKDTLIQKHDSIPEDSLFIFW